MCIQEYLQGQRVWFETLLHVPVPSATKFAQSLHVPGRLVAKAVLLKTRDRFVLAVLPATSRIDMARMGEVLSERELALATEDEVMTIFGDCERGALPPFGRLYGLTTVVDASLSGGSEVVFMANMRHEAVRMRYRDYEEIENPMRARFATIISPPQRRTNHRRAG